MSRRALWWWLTAAGAAAAGAIALWAPSAATPAICVFRRAVDLPCPGCGLTRAFGHLLRGDFAAALGLHPLAPLVALELLAGWSLLGLAAHGWGPDPRRLRLERWAAATGFLLVALWLGRLAIGDLSVIR